MTNTKHRVVSWLRRAKMRPSASARPSEMGWMRLPFILAFLLIGTLSVQAPAQAQPTAAIVGRVIGPLFERALIRRGIPNAEELAAIVRRSEAFGATTVRVAEAIAEYSPIGTEFTEASVSDLLGQPALMRQLTEEIDRAARLVEPQLGPDLARFPGAPQLPPNLFQRGVTAAAREEALGSLLGSLARMHPGRVVGDTQSRLAQYLLAHSQRALPSWFREIRTMRDSQQRLIQGLAELFDQQSVAENERVFHQLRSWLRGMGIHHFDRQTLIQYYPRFIHAAEVNRLGEIHSPEILAFLRRRACPRLRPFDAWLREAMDGGATVRRQLMGHLDGFFTTHTSLAVEDVPEFEQFLNQYGLSLQTVGNRRIRSLFDNFLEAVLSTEQRQTLLMNGFNEFLETHGTTLRAYVSGGISETEAQQLFANYVRSLRRADVVRIYSTAVNSSGSLADITRLIREHLSPTWSDQVRRGIRGVRDVFRRFPRAGYVRASDSDLGLSPTARAAIDRADNALANAVDQSIQRHAAPSWITRNARLPYFQNFLQAADACLARRQDAQSGTGAFREIWRALAYRDTPSETVSDFVHDLIWDEAVTMLMVTGSMGANAFNHIQTQADRINCEADDHNCRVLRQLNKLKEIGTHVVNNDALADQEYAQANEYFSQIDSSITTTAWSGFVGGSNQTINRRFTRTAFTNLVQTGAGFGFYKMYGRYAESNNHPLPQRTSREDWDRLQFEMIYSQASAASSTIRYMVLDGLRCMFPRSQLIEIGTGAGRFAWKSAHSVAFYYGRQLYANQ